MGLDEITIKYGNGEKRRNVKDFFKEMGKSDEWKREIDIIKELVSKFKEKWYDILIEE